MSSFAQTLLHQHVIDFDATANPASLNPNHSAQYLITPEQADSACGLWWMAYMAAWLLGIGLQLQRPELGPFMQDVAPLLVFAVYAFLAMLGFRYFSQLVPRPKVPKFATVTAVNGPLKKMLKRLCLANRLLGCLGWAAAAWSLANAQAHWHLSQQLPSHFQGADLNLSGVIASLPQLDENGVSFHLELDASSQASLSRLANSVDSVSFELGIAQAHASAKPTKPATSQTPASPLTPNLLSKVLAQRVYVQRIALRWNDVGRYQQNSAHLKIQDAAPQRLGFKPLASTQSQAHQINQAYLHGRPWVRAGEHWRFTVRLNPVHGLFNFHGFDRELSLFEQRVGATGSVRWGVQLLSAETSLWRGYFFLRLRQWVRDGIEAAVSDTHAAGVLAALAVGDQGAIESHDWDLFRDTGVAHLMSISGLHVTMFAWLAGKLLGQVWRMSPSAMLWVATPWIVRWGGFGAAYLYALCSGWGVPAQRTVWMLFVVTLITCAGRQWPWPMILLAAAVMVSALDPWALMQPGFHLSFMAVALLLMAQNQQPNQAEAFTRSQAAGGSSWFAKILHITKLSTTPLLDAVQQGVKTQWRVTWGLTPLTLICFHQVSLVGFVANLVAIPAVTLVITPLSMLGVLWPQCWRWGALFIEYLCQLLSFLAEFPYVTWALPAAPWWVQLCALLGSALAMLKLPWTVRALSIPLIIPLLVPVPKHVPWGEFEALVMDVGQGTAVGIQTAQHWLLFDTGPSLGAQTDAGKRVIVPLMQALGIKRVDRLIISHNDSDHSGGAVSLLRAHQVGSIWGSIAPNHPIVALSQAKHVPLQACVAGQSWQWDGVEFTVLHPKPSDEPSSSSNLHNSTHTDEQARHNEANWPQDSQTMLASASLGRSAANNTLGNHGGPQLIAPSYAAANTASGANASKYGNAASCVVRVSNLSKSMLLTGDIGKKQEAALVDQYGHSLTSTVMMVAHHGSKTSSSGEWLIAVKPQLAIVQAGYRNRFGHPADSVMQRYARFGIPVIQSVECGAWRWRSSQDSNLGECARQVHRRYWHWRSGYLLAQ